jgi:DDE superfamily endonuclease
VGVPLDWLIAVSESGYINEELGVKWLFRCLENTWCRKIRRWRLLILDGADAHISTEFIKTYIMNEIVSLSLPPRTTHVLQSLDVNVFLPLKHYHTQKIADSIQIGDTEFSKLDFLHKLATIRNEMFKDTTIKGAFRKTGIWPVDVEIVIKPLADAENVDRQATPPHPISAVESLNRRPSTVAEF